MADLSKITLPNNTTVYIKDAYKSGIYTVIGTQTAATGTWTGALHGVPALYDGLTIMYYLPFAPSGNATLNLTLDNGTTTGAVNCYYNTGRLTTHYGKGSNIVMTYYSAGSISIDGTATTDNRWIANANYIDGNDQAYQVRDYHNRFVAGANKIFPYTIIMQCSDGKWESIVTSSSAASSKARNTHGFRLGQLALMYANATYNENAVLDAAVVYESYTSGLVDHRYSFNTENNATKGTTANKPMYLVGAINATDGLFYLDETWWTQTLPTTADGKLYIYIGDAYDYYRMSFPIRHPIYCYTNGKIRQYSQDAGTVNGLTVQTAVPANAVFTDHYAWSDITGKPSTYPPSSHNHSEIVTVGDQRSTATTPNDYSNRIIFKGLKGNSTIGSPSTDTYSYLVGLRGWSDSSGGNSHELAFNNSGIYARNGATTTWGDWQALGRFTATPTTGQVIITDGATGGIKSSGYTIAKSVPSNAVFTDTKVTSSSNHYTPATATGGDISASASGGTAAWSIDVVQGVTLNTDSKGHVTGLSVTSGKIPANPNSDIKVKQTLSTTNKNYPLLLSYAESSSTTANIDNVSYRANTIYANPSTGNIQATQLNGVAIGSSPKFTDTTYTLGNSGESVTLTPAGGSAQTVSLSTLINGLGTGSSTPVDADYYVSQYVGGGTTTTSYHRRPMSALWTYIKGKADATYLPLAGGTMTGGITFNKVTNAIAYTGTKSTYNMIKFKDNTADTYGNGIVIGGGGLVVVGGGESADSVAATHTSGGDEVLDLCSDGAVYIWTNVQSGATSTDVKKFTFDTAGSLTATKFIGPLQGNADTATKLGTSTVGGTTTPIYLNGGTPTALSYTIAKSVPSTAVFTDTTYTFANGTNGFTVTPAGGTAQTVTVTPSITNNVTGSGTSGYLTKWNGTNTITNGPQLGSGTTTYLRNDGNWSSPVVAGTAAQLAYYSSANDVSSSPNLYYWTANSTATTPATRSILGVYGTTYGNTAGTMISGTAGLFSYGDGGPQIDFNASKTGSQAGALIFTDHDTAAAGVSWHFVSNQTDWNVTSKRFHARTSISVGTNLPTTTHNLYVSGTGSVTTSLISPILGINATNGTSGGISLYNGASSIDTYGIAFRTTANQGKHGYVQGDWATYFTMSNNDSRGWVFKRNSIGGVASISTDGDVVFNGSVTIGGNTTNTSGAKMQYNSTTQAIDFVFN